MTLQDCYEQLGGNYQDVMSRLGSERLVQRFMFKFLDDNSYALLAQALSDKDYETAFRAAHTLKGICMNLGFTRLQASSSGLTEALRGGLSMEAAALYPQVAEDYTATRGAIQEFKTAIGNMQ